MLLAKWHTDINGREQRFQKLPKHVQSNDYGERMSFEHMVLKQLYICKKKKQKTKYLNTSQLKQYRPKCKSQLMQLLEKNREENLHNQELYKDFLGTIPKALSIKEKKW